MAQVVIPSFLATQAGGQKHFETHGQTIAAALRGLPVSDLLFDEAGVLRPLVNVYVDGTDIRERGGIEAALTGDETVRVVAAIAGG